MRWVPVLLALLAPLPAAAAPGDFRCFNREAEIRCADGACEIVSAEQGFTPMHLARNGETLTLCAYSGCWEGKVQASHERDGVTVLQSALRRRDGAAADAEASVLLSVIHDAPTRIAQINWRGFASVMACDSEG